MSKKMRVSFLAALLFVLVSLSSTLNYAGILAESTVEGPRYGGTLVVIHWEDPKSMNPNAQVDDAGAAIFRNIYNQLFVLTRDYNVVPDLAYAWKASPDAKTWTFYLYPNATWHDGVPVTSRDVKFTFEAIKYLKGVSYGRIKADNIESIECPDNHTVVFHLKTGYAPFLVMVSWYGTWIMPAHIWEPICNPKGDWSVKGDWLNASIPYLTRPIGSGPFKLVEWVRGEHITLEPFLNYHKGRPYLSKIVFKIIPDASVALQAFQAREGDILGQTPELSLIPVINATADTRVLKYPTASRWYIGMNLKKPLFQDVRVRLALAYAINRTEINEKACKGWNIPAKYHYTPAVAWAVNESATLPDYNIAEAERLLDEAGYRRDPATGKRFTITYDCWTGPTEEAIGEVIKDQLAKVGIEVVLRVSEFNIWEERVVKKRDFDIALCDGFQGPDPANFILRVGSEEYINFAGYNNTEVDKLFDQGLQETNLEARKKIYYRIQSIVARDLPYIWILEVTGFGIWHTYFHDMWFEPQWASKVGIGSYQYTWWEKGFSTKTFSEVEAAIAKAEADGRLVGLDQARTLYQQARTAFNQGKYEDAANLCQQAIAAAQGAKAQEQPLLSTYAIGLTVAAIVIVALVVGIYYTRRRKT
jgi:peptide/nickel transport system substrate-binding protein